MKKIKKEMLPVICVGISIGCFVIGFILGGMAITASYVEVLESIQIEEININLNETKIVEATYGKFEYEMGKQNDTTKNN